jgi:hypothetical protein
MKIIKLNFMKQILGCMLAVGLMTFATHKAQAGVVLGGQFYIPMNLKFVVSYYDGNGKLKKLTVTTKDLLLLLGFAKNDKVVRSGPGDIYVVDKNVIVSDLTAGGYLTMNFNNLLSNETDANNSDAFTFTEAGMLSVNFYSDGRQDESNGHGSDFWFEISGDYTGSVKVSATKDNQQTQKIDFKSSALNGDGFDVDVFNVNSANSPSVPVAGNVSGNGSGPY